MIEGDGIDVRWVDSGTIILIFIASYIEYIVLHNVFYQYIVLYKLYFQLIVVIKLDYQYIG